MSKEICLFNLDLLILLSFSSKQRSFSLVQKCFNKTLICIRRSWFNQGYGKNIFNCLFLAKLLLKQKNVILEKAVFINSCAETKNKKTYEEIISETVQNFVRHLLRTFSALKVFNQLAGLIDDILEITDEKHDDPAEDNLEDAEEILDYNIGKSENPPLFAEFIDDTANDEL